MILPYRLEARTTPSRTMQFAVPLIVRIEARSARFDVLPGSAHQLAAVRLGLVDNAGDLWIVELEHLADRDQRGFATACESDGATCARKDNSIFER